MNTKCKEIAAKAILNVSAFVALAEARATMLLCDDAFTKAETAATSLRTSLYSLASKLFPLAIIICAVAMFFTRDQKKFEVEKSIMIGCCLAYALVVVVGKNGNIAQTTIENLFKTGT